MFDDLHVGLILALTIRGLAVTSYGDMRRVAGLAEEAGFDSIWLCDHFLTLAPEAYVEDAGITGRGSAGPRAGGPVSMPLLECWTTLSALARDTRRLRLGTSVLCHSYRSPSVLAKMAATLDVISEGRLELGLGAGWFEHEYRAYGIPFPRIGERIDQLGGQRQRGPAQPERHRRRRRAHALETARSPMTCAGRTGSRESSVSATM